MSKAGIENLGARFVIAVHGDIVIRTFNRWVRWFANATHRFEFQLDWGGARRPPEWFDHFFDQYWRWRYTQNPMGWERGVFAALAIAPGARVLDLCCGDGFFAYHFYASRASAVMGIDFDRRAISHAKKNFRLSNLEFRCADIRNQMPDGPFDAVIWNAAIEHFTPAEINALLGSIKGCLAPTGTLAGYTIIERQDGKAHPDHEYEFKSRSDLIKMLKPYFANVLVFDTKWSDQIEERENLYFFASAGTVPFDQSWPHQTRA